MYQMLCEQAKSIIKKDASMKFYNEKEQLYHERERGAGPLQVMDGI